MSPTVVSGSISSLSDLGRDEAWLNDWLKEQPARLGLGELAAVDEDGTADAESDGTHSFCAASEGRQFSVDVQLGELDASHGFGALDRWARSRAGAPDKEHVAVLVTESAGERYRTTLETLSQHLPLVVVELQVWRGESEAIVVPHVALASTSLDLGAAPAVAAAKAVSAMRSAAAVAASRTTAAAPTAVTPADEPAGGAPAKPATDGKAATDDKAAADELKAAEEAAAADARAEGADAADGDAHDKDDTGVRDPWGLPTREPERAGATSNGSRLLSRFNS